MTVTALIGPSYLMPLNSLTVLALLGGLGLYARSLGGRPEWMVPVGLVVGILVGVVALVLGLRIPRSGMVLSVLVVAAGLLVALAPRCPETLAMIGAVVIGAVAGVSGLVTVPSGGLDWIGLATGLIITASVGVGLGALLSQAASWRSVRGLGLVIVGYGAFLIFVIT